MTDSQEASNKDNNDTDIGDDDAVYGTASLCVDMNTHQLDSALPDVGVGVDTEDDDSDQSIRIHSASSSAGKKRKRFVQDSASDDELSYIESNIDENCYDTESVLSVQVMEKDEKASEENNTSLNTSTTKNLGAVSKTVKNKCTTYNNDKAPTSKIFFTSDPNKNFIQKLVEDEILFDSYVTMNRLMFEHSRGNTVSLARSTIRKFTHEKLYKIHGIRSVEKIKKKDLRQASLPINPTTEKMLIRRVQMLRLDDEALNVEGIFGTLNFEEPPMQGCFYCPFVGPNGQCPFRVKWDYKVEGGWKKDTKLSDIKFCFKSSKECCLEHNHSFKDAPVIDYSSIGLSVQCVPINMEENESAELEIGKTDNTQLDQKERGDSETHDNTDMHCTDNEAIDESVYEDAVSDPVDDTNEVSTVSDPLVDTPVVSTVSETVHGTCKNTYQESSIDILKKITESDVEAIVKKLDSVHITKLKDIISAVENTTNSREGTY